MPDVPQPVPGQRRRDEAVRSLREVPEARLSCEARSRAPSGYAAGGGTGAVDGRSLPRILRILVAVVLTAIVFYAAHPSDVIRATAGADLRWLLAAVALVLIDRSLMALRWIDLLVALTPGSRPPFPRVLRIFFVSSFVSNFVPSVAADMYRAYALARHDVHLAESTASVLMDRILGVLSMALVGAVALPFAGEVVEARGLAAGLSLAFAASLVAALVVFSESAATLVQRGSQLVPIAALRRVTVSLTDAV